MVNELTFNNTMPFNGQPIPAEVIVKCFDFAYSMAEGFHRENRSGGEMIRKPNQIFVNTFQGKLAGFMMYLFFTQHQFTLDEPDCAIYSRGEWDTEDLEVNGKSISIKSTSFKGNFLLLETKDHNENGTYTPSNKTYNYTVLMRIKPDLKTELKSKRLFFDDTLSPKTVLLDIINCQQWLFDIAGYITNLLLIDIISRNQIIAKNGTINTYTKMDAENYYIESGDMLRIDTLCQELR